MWPSAPPPRSPRLSVSKSVAEPRLSPGSADSHPLLGDWRLDPHRAVWPGGGYSWEHAPPVCPAVGPQNLLNVHRTPQPGGPSAGGGRLLGGGWSPDLWPSVGSGGAPPSVARGSY